MSFFLFRARFRRALAWTAGIAAVVLAVRAGAGPFRIPGVDIVVNSPFRLETIFWFSALALMLRPRKSAADASGRALPDDGFPRTRLVAVLCVIALAYVRNLGDPFLSDDYIIMNVGRFSWAAFARHLISKGGDGNWRPLGFAYYSMAGTLAGASPLKWHLLSLGFHLANSALVFRVTWKLWRNPAAAVVAGAAFGLNGTRPEAAVWTAGSNDLLATLCVLAAANVALSEPIGPHLAVLLSSVLTAIGILFKESAYAAPVLLAAVLLKRGSGWRVLAGPAAICAALFAWRWHVFGGPGGYNDPATGKSLILSLHFATTAKALLGRIWSILLVPLNWDAPAHWWLPASVLASTLGLIVLLTCRRSDEAPSRRMQLALMAAVIGTALPAIHLAVIGQSVLGSRILYLSGAAFALLLGSTLVGAGQRGAIAATIMLLGTAGILENNLSAWRDVSLKARDLCAEAAAGGAVRPAETLEGVYLFRNGFAECVAAARTTD